MRRTLPLINTSLIDEIAAAFPLEPIPAEDDLTHCTYDKKYGGSLAGPCSDCCEIADFFAGKPWNQPSVLEYRRFCDAITLMTQTAFNYFLPGWMTASLIHCEDADVIPDYLLYAMSGTAGIDESRIERCYDTLNITQLLCIKRFIDWYAPFVGPNNMDVHIALERLSLRIPNTDSL
jgi:hypothetical protein